MKCEVCDGKGSIKNGSGVNLACASCGGTGKVPNAKTQDAKKTLTDLSK